MTPDPEWVETETEKHTRLLNEAGWRTQPEPKRLTLAEKLAAARTAKLKSPQPEPPKPVDQYEQHRKREESARAMLSAWQSDPENAAARARNLAALAAETPAEERLRHPLETWSMKRSGRRRL